ncbi:TetR/AcrR family transcriptional regulator [Kineosporia sp. NBRC 101731]|uniref:TetR/AcrR family transcriptional regulator n=1 Tax=Kineosporia sp. NBRC 101731 TaxID=3032199 RepID=UPI0024A47F42|nr:TetR/AcrR family transcriptional regulator [Kineosporia sp. NBRC 101731]GLY29883.1 TetR family transcriptional regulator [Kineosporia sp. NBRC 101731]
MTVPGTPGRPRRADARRNTEGIRRAALDVFRSGGLNSPLEEVAQAAGVSKGTIYHRFGSRRGLIDAVVDELVAERIQDIIATVEQLHDPRDRFEQYLLGIWLLQFDEPAANDVLMRTTPDSEPLSHLCAGAQQFASGLLCAAQQAGTVRADITPDDINQLILERGVVVRACDQQPRDDYRRRLRFVLDGLLVNTRN